MVSPVVWLPTQIPRGKKKESILQQKWPRNNFIVEDNAYKSHAFAYIKEMDQLLSTYNIVDSEEKESRFTTYLKGVMKMDDKEETAPTIIICKRWNDGHQWGKANHAMSYTNVKNRFQWREYNTFEDWLYAVHWKQSLTMPLKFTTIGIEKPRK